VPAKDTAPRHLWPSPRPDPAQQRRRQDGKLVCMAGFFSLTQDIHCVKMK
jgi:hypothetical protein